MKQITREEREKMAEYLKKIKYKEYQAGIALISHDNERLNELAGKIGNLARKIKRTLMEKKVVYKHSKKRRSSIRVK